MTHVIFFVVGLLTALPVVYPFLFIIWPIVCGIPMMLYYTKIQKFGMLTITGIIGGIFFYLIGYGWIGLLGWVLGGILSDVVLKIGGYQKFKVTVLSYACFALASWAAPPISGLPAKRIGKTSTPPWAISTQTLYNP